jgi:hypothetical protein
MAAEYRVDVKSRAGALRAVVTDYLALSYTKSVNAPGLLQLTLAGDHPALAQLELDGQLEIWRRDARQGIAWYRDFTALYRHEARPYDQQPLFQTTCPGALSLLGRRHVLYPAGTADRSAFARQRAETILKTLVAYNAGANATVANGRLRDGAIAGLSVAADAAGGSVQDWNCAYDNLLATCQDLAKVAGGDIDLVPVATGWEFRFHAGQLGTDRTASVVFALQYGNLAKPQYTYDRREEKTVAIVGGQGEGSERQIVVREGPDYAADNDIETFVDGRNDAEADALATSGDRRLAEARAVQQFSFEVLQTEACLYGRDYVLGDLVTARYGTIQATRKIQSVTITHGEQGEETIKVETGNE